MSITVQVLESIAELSILSSIITTTGLSSDFSNTFLQVRLYSHFLHMLSTHVNITHLVTYRLCGGTCNLFVV